jgi:predicted PurR-regulated permease PerM
MAHSTYFRERLSPPLWVVVLGLLAIGLWIVMKLDALCTLLLLGYFIAYVINPWLNWLERHKISRAIGVLVIGGLLLAVFLLAIFTILPVLLDELSRLIDLLPSYLAQLHQRFEPLFAKARSMLPADLVGELQSASPSQVASVGKETFGQVSLNVSRAFTAGYSVTLFVMNLVLLPFIVFYLAIDFKGLHTRALGLFPYSRRQQVLLVAKEIDKCVSAFVRGQLLVCTTLFILYAIALRIVGLDSWFAVAAISGFGHLIPYLGLVLGVIISSILVLVTYGDWTHLLEIVIVYVVVQGLEGWVLTPKIVGERVGLSSLTVMLAIIAGGTLFGFLGVLLAVPGTAALRVLLRHLHHWLIYR